MAAAPETAGTTSRSRGDFTLAFVLQALVERKLLTPPQAKDVLAKETQARARVLKSKGAETRDGARYEVSPVEIVAVFQVPVAGGRGEILDEDRVTEAVAQAAGVPYRKIDPLKLDMTLATKTVSRPFATKHVVLPVDRSASGALVVAVANPFDRELFEQLQRLASSRIEPVLSSKRDILRTITDTYGFKKTLAKAATDFAEGGGGISNFEQLVSLSSGNELDASDKPVVQAVDHILRYAFEHRASDIHMEPKRDSTHVRLRIDGVLHPVYTLPAGVHAPLVSRVKMISRLDISEKRRPQDGRIKTERDGREVELRVSTLPTAFGEKVVIRIFDPEAQVQDIAQLGFDPDEKAIFESWIDNPHGLILVTGPTGSGKTTTLYSALKALAGPDLNVTTIEDPIEMVWEGFNQVQVQPKIDLTFAGALRHILRQDPDVIMVGEIRDAETADNAIQAALTGHLVLSTLHTNDSMGAITRMKDLGIPPFLLSSALLGIMAQRLLRRVCSQCSQESSLTPDELATLGVPLPLLPAGIDLRRGAGCTRCRNTGYYGRVGVFEMFPTNPLIRDMVSRNASVEELTPIARKAGMRTLREAAVRKLALGMTAFEEVMRVT